MNVGSSSILQRSIVSEAGERSKQFWVPPLCIKDGLWKTQSTTPPNNISWHYRGRLSHHSFVAEYLRVPSGNADLSVKISKGFFFFFEL